MQRYDLSPANEFLYTIGMGLHHSGVEISGREYSFASGTCAIFVLFDGSNLDGLLIPHNIILQGEASSIVHLKKLLVLSFARHLNSEHSMADQQSCKVLYLVS